VIYKTFFSISPKQLEKLFDAGYLVLRRPLLTREVTDNTKNVFCLGTDEKIFQSTINEDNWLIILRYVKDKPNTQIEIITNHNIIIRIANERFNYQIEPVGTIIRAKCIALNPKHITHIERIVRDLDGYSGMQFIAGNTCDSFEIVNKIESTKDYDVEQEIERIRSLMDALFMITETGYFIRYISVDPLRRMHPSVSIGQVEKMLGPITKESISEAVAIVDSSKEIALILRGLNQSYVDNCYSSRLDRLWATVENVFCSHPEHLLSSEELDAIVSYATKLPIANDESRLKSLIESLKNPDRLPNKSRNERIANNISRLLDRDYVSTYSEIKNCSKLRGQHGHSVSCKNREIIRAEDYLKQVLLQHLGILISKYKSNN